jgi:hypothetical protein
MISAISIVAFIITVQFFSSTTLISNAITGTTLPIGEQLTVTIHRSFSSLLPYYLIFAFILLILNIIVIYYHKNRGGDKN